MTLVKDNPPIYSFFVYCYCYNSAVCIIQFCTILRFSCFIKPNGFCTVLWFTGCTKLHCIPLPYTVLHIKLRCNTQFCTFIHFTCCTKLRYITQFCTLIHFTCCTKLRYITLFCILIHFTCCTKLCCITQFFFFFP